MDGSSRKLAENLSEANKSADKLARGALSKLTKELQEVERSSSRVNLNIGGLLSKLGAARAFAGKGLGNIFGKGFLGLTEGAGAARGLSDIAKLFGKRGAGFSNLTRGISDATFSFTGLQAAAVATQKALNFVSPVASAVGSFITLERSAKNMTENIINSFRNMNRKIVFDSLQSFKQFGFMYDPRSALNMDIWKNFEDMKGGGFAGMKGIQSQGKAALGGMFAPQIGRGLYGGTTFPNRAQGLRNLSQIGLPLQAIQMSGVDTSLMGFPKDEAAYIEQLRENIQLGKDVNRENFRRKKTLEEVLKVENKIENQIRENIALSKKAREASGFGFGLAGDPVAKSINRNRRKVERRLAGRSTGFTSAQYGPQPMYGPSMPPNAQFDPWSGQMLGARGSGSQSAIGKWFGSRKLGGVASSAMIGGGFPFLFGQGGASALGGGIGGAAGGLLGGGFGFGLSIVGTAIGQWVTQTDKFNSSLAVSNQRLENMGASSQLTSANVKNIAKALRISKDEALSALQAFEKFGDNAGTLTAFFGQDATAFNAVMGIKDQATALQAVREVSKGISLEQELQLVLSLKNLDAEKVQAVLKEKLLRITYENNKALAEQVGLGERIAYWMVVIGRMAAPGLIPPDWGLDPKLRIEKDLKAIEDRFNKAKAIMDEYDDVIKGIGTAYDQLKLPTIPSEIEKISQELERLQDPIFQITSAATAIGDAFSSSFKGIISGSMSVQQALANLFQRTADHFLDMAAQILAAQIRAKIVGIFANSFASASYNPGNSLQTNAPGVKGVSTVSMYQAANGAYFSGGIKPFASGGMATRPTLGLIGEAGEDEYIIPASKMAASMQRYSAGARGEAVIPGTGSSYAGSGAGGSTTVNYSGPILNFNSEEFVPKSAVGQIIATATSQGAKAGEARTLSSLQNSRSRRSNLGL